MKSFTLTRLLAGAFAISVLACSFSQAQLSMERVVALNKTLQTVKATYNKLTPTQRKMLDGYANVVQFADFWQKHGMSLTDPRFADQVRARLASIQSGCAFGPGRRHSVDCPRVEPGQ